MDLSTAALMAGTTLLVLALVMESAHRLLQDAPALRWAGFGVAASAVGSLAYLGFPRQGVLVAEPAQMLSAAALGTQVLCSVRALGVLLGERRLPAALWLAVPLALAGLLALGAVDPRLTLPGAALAYTLLGAGHLWVARRGWQARARLPRRPMQTLTAVYSVAAVSFLLWALYLAGAAFRPRVPVGPTELAMLGVNLAVAAWLTLLGGASFILVVLVQLTERLVQASFTDPLTQLLNRRGLAQRLQDRLRDSAARPVAVLAVDLDHFKRINDERGHAAGDEVLVWCARRLSVHLRSGDLVARTGGEEFVIVAFDAGAGVAAELGERVRASIEQHPVRLGPALPPLAVTASLGVACAGGLDGPTGFEALLARADSALYRAKHEGRNRVVLAPPA